MHESASIQIIYLQFSIIFFLLILSESMNFCSTIQFFFGGNLEIQKKILLFSSLRCLYFELVLNKCVGTLRINCESLKEDANKKRSSGKCEKQ